jgi:hypothetical protein
MTAAHDVREEWLPPRPRHSGFRLDTARSGCTCCARPLGCIPHLPHGWIATVAGRNGFMLPPSQRPQQLFGKPVPDSDRRNLHAVKSLCRDGSLVVRARAAPELPGWHTAVWAPMGTLDPTARELRLALAAPAVLAFAASLLAATLVGCWLAHSVAGVKRNWIAGPRGFPGNGGSHHAGLLTMPSTHMGRRVHEPRTAAGPAHPCR